jgi:hypothetical protein
LTVWKLGGVAALAAVAHRSRQPTAAATISAVPLPIDISSGAGVYGPVRGGEPVAR